VVTGYVDLLGDENCRAFLALIRRCEGAGYNTLFGGGTFAGWADHPRQKVTRMAGGRALTSSAAGAYQFLARTWDDCVTATGLTDFSPASQDIAALWLIDRREALGDVIAGEWLAAIGKCNKEWASLPGSPYGQPTRSMEFCLAVIAGALTPAPLPVGEGSLTPSAPAPLSQGEDRPPSQPPSPTGRGVGGEGGIGRAIARVFTLPDFLKALKAGDELAKPETWKRAQVWTGSLTALLGALAAIANAYGYPIPLDEAQIAALVSALAVLVGVFQSWATIATTRRIGLPPGADTVGAGPADPGGPRVVARPAAVPRRHADADGDLPVLTEVVDRGSWFADRTTNRG